MIISVLSGVLTPTPWQGAITVSMRFKFAELIVNLK
jgi:hypothetical protein